MKCVIPAVILALLAPMSVGALPASADSPAANGYTFSIKEAGPSPRGGVTTWFVAKSGTNDDTCGASSAPCLSIAFAVGKASSGDAINVNSGIYEETISAGDPLTITGMSATLVGSIAFASNLNGTSRIEGFTFKRPASVPHTLATYSMIAASGASHTLDIRNNTFDLQSGSASPPLKGSGAALRGTATWRVTENTFLNQQYTAYDSRTLFFSNAAPAVVHNNVFSGVGHGVFLTGAGPSGSEITSNSFDADLAVVIGIPSGVVIRGNDFVNGSAVSLEVSTNAQVSNNRFTATYGAALWQLGKAGVGTVTGTVYRDNDLSTPGYPGSESPYGGKSIFSQTSGGVIPGTPDLARNWWGAPTSPTTIATAGNFNNPVTVEPRITAYTAGAAPAGFVAGRGFWPEDVVLSNQLSGLTVSGGLLDPSFASDDTAYSVNLSYEVSTIGVTPTVVTGSGATISVDDSAVASGQEVAIGIAPGQVKTLRVEVKNGAPSPTVYEVTVTRAAPSSDSSLASLAVSPGTLSPGFAPGTLAYSASVANSVTSIVVTPTATDATSTITVDGVEVASGISSRAIPLTVGVNTIPVVVTAQDGVSKATYTITVTRAAAPPDPGPIPIPTPTPTPTPSPSPSPTPVPVPTPLPPGEAEVIVDGQPQTVVVEPQPGDAGLQVTGDGFELELDAAAPNGTGVPVRTEDGRSVLVLETEGFTRTAGTGFQPGSQTYVWLFSEPTLLGSIPVDAQGRFLGEVSLPVDIGPGEHMLQVTGTTPTGATRALVLGVVVEPAAVPGAPTNVTPVPGNRQVAVAWTPPSRPGATRITGYRIEQSRNGGPWTVAIANTGSASPASRASATVRNLINGDDYRFRITAINAAGLGRVSEPSASTSPEAPEGRSIAIVGQRTTIDGKSGVRVRGETTGFTRKASLRPWIRLPGQTAFIQGQGRIRLKADGTFTWKRKTGKRITVYIQAGDGTRSNRVVIPAR